MDFVAVYDGLIGLLLLHLHVHLLKKSKMKIKVQVKYISRYLGTCVLVTQKSTLHIKNRILTDPGLVFIVGRRYLPADLVFPNIRDMPRSASS